MSSQNLLHVFIFLAAACVVVPIVNRFRLGAVLGYLVAGVVIGPWGLGLITDPQKVLHFAEFGVVMMLFVIGLELEPPVLWRMRTWIVGLGGLQMLLTTAALATIGMMVGYSWSTSLAAAMALSLSSTALVLQMLEEKNLMNTSVGETAFSVLLFQDIAVIPILVLMPLLAAPAEEAALQRDDLITHLPGYWQALIVAAVIGLLIMTGRYFSIHLFRVIARSRQREIFTALSLALIVGITLLMLMIGVSPALGAFIAGVVLANSEYRHSLETDIEPFKGLLLGLFFISVGMGMDFGLLAKDPLAIIAGVLCLVMVKTAIVGVIARLFRIDSLHAIGCALALSQGGEFAFVLFTFARDLNLMARLDADYMTLIVALSMATTPLLMLWYSHVVTPRFMSILPDRDYDSIAEQHPVIIAGFGRFGQIIGRFLLSQGVGVTVLEKDIDQVDLLRKFDFKGYFGDATRLDLLRNAGADKAKALIVAVDEVETSLQIVRLARQAFPHLTIFARARNRRHAYELDRLGVTHFKRELFESSLSMAREIMVWMGAPAHEIDHRVAQFRQHDEATLRDSFRFFEDEPALINFSRTRRSELEQILRNDAPPLDK
jgi:monovalent cation:proton antiporter-2 (CPA2) family protein